MGALGSSQVAPHELVISFQSLSLPLTATEVTAARPPVSVMDRRSHAPAPLKSITATWGGGGEGGGEQGRWLARAALCLGWLVLWRKHALPRPSARAAGRHTHTHPHTHLHGLGRRALHAAVLHVDAANAGVGQLQNGWQAEGLGESERQQEERGPDGTAWPLHKSMRGAQPWGR